MNPVEAYEMLDRMDCFWCQWYDGRSLPEFDPAHNTCKLGMRPYKNPDKECARFDMCITTLETAFLGATIE
jgi:hypothetical protein